MAKVAKLARLDVSEADLDRYTGQLAGMLDHFSDIDALDLAERGARELAQGVRCRGYSTPMRYG